MKYESSNNSRAVIVIGAARSGTKFLRDLIGASASCRVVPYDVNYIWRIENEELPHDVLAVGNCSPGIATKIRRNLSAIALPARASSNSQSFLVEKTVSNCLRVPFVEEVFPDALYVHLLRDGRDVVESSVRMWKEPVRLGHLLRKVRHFPLSNLSYAIWYMKNIAGGLLTRDQGVKIWGVRYAEIEEDIKRLSVPEVCAMQWRKCVEKPIGDLAAVSPARVIEVRYEALTSEEDEVHRICDFLQLPDPEQVLQAYHRNNRPPGSQKWRTAFDGREWESAMGIMQPTLDTLGYD
jgi:hypothetical protein